MDDSKREEAKALIAEAFLLATNARDSSTRRDGDKDWNLYRSFLGGRGGPERLLSILSYLQPSLTNLEPTSCDTCGCETQYPSAIHLVDCVDAAALTPPADPTNEQSKREAIYHADAIIQKAQSGDVAYIGEHLQTIIWLRNELANTRGPAFFIRDPARPTPATREEIAQAVLLHTGSSKWKAEAAAKGLLSRFTVTKRLDATGENY